MRAPRLRRPSLGFAAAEYLPAGILLVLAELGLFLGPQHLRGSRALLVIAFAVGTTALLWRRRFPLRVLLVLGAVLLVPSALGSYVQSAPAVLALVLAVFSCGRYGRLPVAYVALPVAIAFALLGAAADPQETLASSWLWSLNVIWIFGIGLWLQQAHELVLRSRGEVDAAARAAAAEERLRVARDLHDVLGHSLSVMVLQAEAADELFDRNPDAARAALARVQESGRKALGETRRVLGLLRSAEAGSVPAPAGLDEVAHLVHQFESAGLPVTLDMPEPPAVSPSVGQVAYRVLQEALTNAMRHSGLEPTRVRVLPCDSRLLVEVENDGAQATVGRGGFGLLGMQERVRAAGGTVESAPRPGGGFSVRAELPLEAPS